MMRILPVIYICMAMLASACSSRQAVLSEGDLLFSVTGSDAFERAIQQVTSEGLPSGFTHVGIVVSTDGPDPVVMEAVFEGVRVTSLSEFLSRASLGGGRPLVAVGRLRAPYRHTIPDALRRIEGYAGRPYDFAFAPGDDALYCSELVYRSFLDERGRPIFTARPMTFRETADGETSPLWRDYFLQLGSPPPEGAAGTNPQDMSRDTVLEIIYRYY